MGSVVRKWQAAGLWLVPVLRIASRQRARLPDGCFHIKRLPEDIRQP